MKPKYPVRKWLGKYESWLYQLYGRGSMLFNDKHLEKFFSFFPATSGLEQFGTPDIHQYKLWRTQEENFTPFKLLQEIKCLERFYRYLIEDQGLPLSNPAKPFINQNPRTIVRRKKDSLRLEEYRRLLEACIRYEPTLVDWMSRVVQGVRPNYRYITSQKAGRLFKKVGVKAGMPYVSLRHLKTSLRHGLWREIIQDWSNRFFADLCNTQPSNPPIEHVQLAGDPFGNIEFPSLDVRTSIINPSYDPLSIAPVSNQQESSEA